MFKHKITVFYCVLLLMVFHLSGCSEDDATGPDNPSVCFTVSGFEVTIYNMWEDGSDWSKNLRGYVSFNQTVSMNDETHSLDWSNIENNYTLNRTTAFDVKIDGTNYSYPEDACEGEEPPEEATNYISFKVDGTQYFYEESDGQPGHPNGYYYPEQGSRPEQYIIVGALTSGISQPVSSKIIIGFINANGWFVDIIFYDENANILSFRLPSIDISVLQNRDNIGQQMTAKITTPINSPDTESVLTDLEFSVERIEVEDPGGDPDPDLFLTHSTGSLDVSVFNNGNIGHLGYQDYIGNGVTYKSYMDAVYSAGLIFGTTSRGSINGQIGSFSITDDFTNLQTFSGFNAQPSDWDQVAVAKFDDSSAPMPYGLTVKQTSYSKTGENSVFIKYTFYNSAESIDNFYAGIFSDWDVGGSECLQSNLGGYDQSRNLAYEYCSSGLIDPNYYGIVALNNMSGARVTTTGTGSTIRDSSFVWITTFFDEPLNSPGDYRMWIGSGPFTINGNDSLEVHFAVLAGDNLDHLKANADAAIQKYNGGLK